MGTPEPGNSRHFPLGSLCCLPYFHCPHCSIAVCTLAHHMLPRFCLLSLPSVPLHFHTYSLFSCLLTHRGVFHALGTALAQVLFSVALQLLYLIGKSMDLNTAVTETQTFSLVTEEPSPSVFPLCNLKFVSAEAMGICFFFSPSPVFRHPHRDCKMAAVWREVFYIFAALFIISSLSVLSLCLLSPGNSVYHTLLIPV